MSRTVRWIPFVLLIATLGFLPARAEPRTGYLLEQHVPASSLLFVSGDRIEDLESRWQETGLGRLMADEEMQAFLKPIHAQMEELAQQSMSMMPPGAMELLQQLSHVKGQIALALVDADPQNKRVEAAMSIDFKDSTEGFKSFLQGMQEQMDPQGQNIHMETREGRLWLSIDAGGMPITATVTDTTLLVATDAALLDQMLQPAGDDALANAPEFRKVRARCGGEDLAIFGYGNVHAALDRFGGQMPAQERGIADALGLDTIDSVAYGMSFQGDGFRDTLMVHAPDADHGLIPLVRMAPMRQPRTLDMAPEGTFWWGETSLNFSELLPGIRTLAQRVDPEAGAQIDQAVQMANQILQVDVEKDLLGGLAGPYGAYMTFPPAGGLFPEVAMAFVVKDPASFEPTFVKVCQGIAGQLNEENDVVANLRELAYHGSTMHLFGMQAAHGNDPVPFTPTWAMIGDRLVITLVPNTMKEIVLRQGATGTPGLAAKADFSKLLELKPADAGGMEYLDVHRGLTMLYGTVVPLLQAVAKPNVMEEVPFEIDWALLPPASRVSKYFGSVGEYMTWNKDGIVLSWQGPIPMLPLVGMMGAGVGLLSARTTVSRPTAMVRRGPSTVEPKTMSATDQEMDMELAQLQLEIFAEAVEVYRQNNEALPDSLGQLAESGYVKAPIAKDPWKGDYQYGKTEKGFRIVSAGPDGAFGTPDDLELERE